ncbi:MAG: lipoyl(octanoyl) transferase LipB [Dehalococcoidia bacterium]
MSAGSRIVRVYDLGTTRYQDVHRLQQGLQAQRRGGGGEDALLLTEHRPVFTLGRSHPEPSLRVARELVEQQGIDIVQTERGGDITYHGPGQLVGYGIIDLKGWDLGVIDYVDGLEETVIKVVADWGIQAGRKPGARGVWVGHRKIASVGINVRRYVTMHGVALNVSPNMEHIALMNPCGMPDAEMTSLSAEVGKPIAMGEVTESFIYHFGHVFNCQTEIVDLSARASSG